MGQRESEFIGFICRTNEDGSLKIEPVLAYQADEGYSFFSSANGEIKELFDLDERDNLRLNNVWDKEKQDFIAKEESFLTFEEGDWRRILSSLKDGGKFAKLLDGFLPVKIVFEYFFGGDGENLFLPWSQKNGNFPADEKVLSSGFPKRL